MNKWTRFIDSCVGDIARKIQDEFDESKHPRDKGGKFTSKGGEGRGGSTKESTNKKTKPVTMAWTGTEEDAERLAKKHGIDYKLVPGKGEDPYTYIEVSGDNKKVKNFIVNEGFDGDEKEAKKWVPEAFNESGTSSSKSAKKVNSEASKHIHSALEDDIRQIAEESADKDEFKYNLEAFLEDYVQDDYANTDERAMDNFGYDKETVHAVAEEMKGEIDDIADDFFEEDDDDTSVTGPEDRDYMLEEDDDADVSLEQYKKNVSENFDGDEEYDVEARYDRAKFHSDQFKKLKNGEFYGTPKEKQLKNYYRRLGIKKPEDAFKVWWDI